MLLCILTNSIVLANLDFRVKNLSSDKNNFLNYVNAFFTVIYILEAIIKIIAYGLILQKHSFLRHYLNYLDLIIIMGGYYLLILTLF